MDKTQASMDDDALYDLFSAFDDVSASDQLKQATLEHIASQAEPGSGAEHDGAAPAAGPKDARDESAEAPVFTAERGGKAASPKARMKAKWRAIRVAAVAACLVLALSGGAAYAMPVSHVTLSQGDAHIELGVNRFGVTVSATSDDEVGKQIVETADLCNVSYEESLARAYDSLEKSESGKPFELNVQSNDDAQRSKLESENEEFLASRSALSEASDPSAASVAAQYSNNGDGAVEGANAQPASGAPAGSGDQPEQGPNASGDQPFDSGQSTEAQIGAQPDGPDDSQTPDGQGGQPA